MISAWFQGSRAALPPLVQRTRSFPWGLGSPQPLWTSARIATPNSQGSATAAKDLIRSAVQVSGTDAS